MQHIYSLDIYSYSAAELMQHNCLYLILLLCYCCYSSLSVYRFYISGISNQLTYSVPAGIYILPSFSNIRRWYGLIFIRKGFYRSGIFRFYINISIEYPHTIPTIKFITECYHPLIHLQTGELDLIAGFPSWSKLKPEERAMKYIVAYIKKVFYKTEWWDEKIAMINRQAASLYAKNRDEFIRRVERCCLASIDSVYSDKKDLLSLANNLFNNNNTADDPFKVTKHLAVHDELWQRIKQTAEEAEKHSKQQQEQEEGSDRKEDPQRGSLNDIHARHLFHPDYLSWFLPGVDNITDHDPTLISSSLPKLTITAAEEKEWREDRKQQNKAKTKQVTQDEANEVTGDAAAISTVKSDEASKSEDPDDSSDKDAQKMIRSHSHSDDPSVV